MKAVIVKEFGGYDKLIYSDIPVPKPEPNSITVKIRASSINHLDIWVRKGVATKASILPLILGSDGSGEIINMNSDNNKYDVGDEVVIQPGIYCGKCQYCNLNNENYCTEYGILGETHNGTQAEIINVNINNIYKKPKHLTYEEAASMPLVFMTAYQMIVERAKLIKKETILIYGGSSGIGSAAIQISKNLGAYVISTSGTDDKCEYSLKMGSDYVINHNKPNWINKIKDITNNRGIDVVFEHIGLSTWDQSLRILGIGGRIVTCGATTGNNVNLNLSHLFIKNQSILGSTMSNINIFKKVMKKISLKEYVPFVDKVFPLSDVAIAHQYIENRKHKGKVILVP